MSKRATCLIGFLGLVGKNATCLPITESIQSIHESHRTNKRSVFRDEELIYGKSEKHKNKKHSGHRRRSRDVPLSASFPVDYGGNHPYEIMARSRELQKDTPKTGEDRRLQDNDQYKPIRFSFVTQFLAETRRDKPEIADHIDFIGDDILPKVAQRWSKALSVFPSQRIELQPSEQCYDDSKYRGLKSFWDADYVAFVYVDSEDCFDETDQAEPLLGFAGPCQLDQFLRPVVGQVTMCTAKIDLNNEASRTTASQTLLHEFAHMLGFVSSFLKFFINPQTGLPRLENLFLLKGEQVQCVNNRVRTEIMPSPDVLQKVKSSDSGRISFELVTPAVRNVVRNQFNCMNMAGARLENQPTNIEDCFGSHWDQRLFHSEFMSPFAGNNLQFLTPLTLAFFEDSGWYKANFSVTSLSPFGHAAGCSFVYEDCIVDGTVPPYSIGNFCAEPTQNGCSPTHNFVAGCSLATYSADIPEEFQYFPGEPRKGGTPSQLDYCPVYNTAIIAAGGQRYDCTNSSISEIGYPFERFGADSRCFEIDSPGRLVRSLCFQTECVEESHSVRLLINGLRYLCESDGQIIETNVQDVFSRGILKVKCPRLAQICPDLVCPKNCAGRGICDYEQSHNPECICNDPNDPSDFCANSPFERLDFPTSSPIVSESTKDPTKEPSQKPTAVHTQTDGGKTTMSPSVGGTTSLPVVEKTKAPTQIFFPLFPRNDARFVSPKPSLMVFLFVFAKVALIFAF